MGSVTCPQCGTVNPAGARFCRGCGLSLTQPLRQSGSLTPPPTTPPPTPPPNPAPPPGGVPTQVRGPGQPGVPPQGAVAQALTGQIGTTPLAPGVSLQGGRYVIEKALGKGGMGSVFLAHDTHVNNKPVVIKEMANYFSTEEERREAEADFQAEMATLAALNHPNIPQISDFFTESNRHFAVQEFVAGQDLEKAINAVQVAGHPPQGLPEKQVLSWITQVLSVLDYLESLNPQVIHRDIKPANILVDANNRVRVVDFGIASHKYKPGTIPGASQQISTALGTPGYAPREQFSGQETPLSDIYALGATMHHLLTGRDPTKIQPLWQYPPVRALNPKISEATERIVARALENDPSKRYQSAAEMKRAVDRILHPPGALNTFRGRVIALAIVLFLLLASAIGIFVYLQIQYQQPAHGYVSTGSQAFDLDTRGRAQSAANAKDWATIKGQAAIAWKNGQKDTAVADYQQATNNDRTDAESWIYQANRLAEQSGQTPYYIAVGGSFSGADIFSGREILQGVYTAQHEINAAGGIGGHPIELVLANDGSTDDGATQSANKVVSWDNGTGGKVLAMVGYRTSTRTSLALSTLAGAQISLVSPTASNPDISNPYFFRVCPTDSFQAAQAVRYMMNNLVPIGHFNARVAIYSDPNDSYSNTLGGLITEAVRRLGGQIINENYTVGATDYASQAQDTLNQHADVVYFAGVSHDALLLARALDAADAAAGTPQDKRIKIMTDQEFYNPSEFEALPGHKNRFYFTSFFFPDEYNRVIIPPAPVTIQAIEGEYKSNFSSARVPLGTYGSDRMPAGSALSYDALELIAKAISYAQGHNGNAIPSRAQVQAALASIGTTEPRYQGITGPIGFAGSGDPANKTILIQHLDTLGRTHMDGFLMDGWLGQYG